MVVVDNIVVVVVVVVDTCFVVEVGPLVVVVVRSYCGIVFHC